MSTELYIQALHSGDYVFFLEWPQFITKTCLNDDCTQDADHTISLLVYEWMQYGFGADDIYHIAILHAVASEPNSVLKSSFSYAATTLAAAAMQCMVYMLKSIEANQINANNLAFNLIDPNENNILLIEQDNELLCISQNNFQATIDARAKIFLVLILEEYMLILDANNNFNAALRLGIAKALCNYLRTQPCVLFEEIQNQITDCINKIRTLEPDVSEETFFLSRISPLPQIDDKGLIFNTLWWGVNFFLKFDQQALEDDKREVIKRP